MKKLVLAALAIAAMAACTKSNVQYEQPGEITLQPVAQKATKAAVDGTVYPTAEAYNFNVWAWWGEQEAGTNAFTGTTPYISEGTFKARDIFNWGGITPYYWPTKGSLVFAGYSPASVKVEGKFKYYLNAVDNDDDGNVDIAANTLMITDYIQSNNIAEAKDLMWFDVTNESYDKNVADNKGVPVTFKHALSWLTFKFNLFSDATAPMWTITDVKLTGIEDKATFTAVKDGTTTWSQAIKSADNKDVIDVYTENSYIVNYEANGTVLPGTDVTGSNVKNNAVLVIPQSCANDAAKLVITYNLKTYVDDGVLTGQTVTLPLNGTEITGDKWEPGKHYIYTITFGAEEILIAPTVANWDPTIETIIPVK